MRAENRTQQGTFQHLFIGFILVGDGQTDTATQNEAVVAFMLCPLAFGIPYGAVKGVFWVVARFQKG
jgi:hypothetical protein